jgi:hypothetical protein
MTLRDLPDMSAAYKEVQEKKNNDGNLANNAVPYDKVTKADIITGAKGKDEQGGKKKPKAHDCAKQVKYEGKEYQVIPEAHTLLEDGTVTHYDIEDAEYIYENVPVGDLEILISEKHEHFDNYEKNAEMLGEGVDAKGAARMDAAKGKKKETQDEIDKRLMMGKYAPGAKKEAFAFSEADLALFEEHGAEIDAMTDEQLIDVMEDFIIETAQDIDDLVEICEHLEGVGMLSEEERDAGAMARAKLNKPAGPSRMDRIKSAAKEAGSRLKAGAQKAGAAAKKGIKAAGKSVASNAGKAVGEFQAARIKQKRAAMSRPTEKKKEAPKSSSSDDGTGGKLDDLLAKSKGTSSSSDSGSSSGGGGESSSSSSSAPAKKKGPGLLRKLGSAVKKGLKKAVGKTSRLVSKGSDKLASRLGEDYDQIAHLYESGLFSIEEIENVIEEGYKEIDQPKKNKMFRRAGNLSRDALQGGDKGTEAHKKSGKIVKQLNKLNQENK